MFYYFMKIIYTCYVLIQWPPVNHLIGSLWVNIKIGNNNRMITLTGGFVWCLDTWDRNN